MPNFCLNRLAVFLIAVITLTSCVSATPYHIVNHDDGHDFKQIIHDCNTSGLMIETSQNTAALDPQNIHLLNWNIHKESAKNWAEDFQTLSQGKEIITLQEALIDEPLHQLLDDQDLYWSLTSAFRYKTAKVGVLTAATVPTMAQCSFHIKEPFIRLPKTLMISLYPLSDHPQDLLVANIHSINFTLGTDKYLEQINVLRRIIQQHKGPVIVAGDFNSWDDNRIQILEQFKLDLSLSALPYQNHNRTRIFGNAIDHIFYRGLIAIDIDTPEVTSSDHNPIIVNFSMQPILNKALSNND